MEFTRQFIEIRKEKHHFSDQHEPKQEKPDEIEWIGEYKDVRKFSFSALPYNEPAPKPKQEFNLKGN